MGSNAQKRLFLLRHAIAVNEMSDGDEGRALAPKGIEDAQALGDYMKHHNYTPDLVLCSSARRTRETLEGVQTHLDAGNVKTLDILYSGSAGDYLYEIQQCDNKYDNILIVAHNPSIYELVRLLAAQGSDSVMQRLSEGYSPASLSVVNCVCEKWADIQPAENTLAAIVNPMDYNAPARPTRWM